MPARAAIAIASASATVVLLAACAGDTARSSTSPAAAPQPLPESPRPEPVPPAPSAAPAALPATTPQAPAAPAVAAPRTTAPTVAQAGKAVRIDAGAEAPSRDADGNQWLADAGFTGGEIVHRGEIAIANTANPALYRSERWGMTAFAWPVPNDKYTVRLHFAETYDEITAAGQRVFTVAVEGHVLKDIDVFKEAGGAARALVKAVSVTVRDGRLDIAFTPGVQSPEINGIEIVPHP